MARLMVVVASAVAIVASAALARPVYALMVGVLLGAYFFLGALARGGGIAQARLTLLPGEARRPGDPAVSIGMGLAAAGIAAPYMLSRDPNLTSAIHVWYTTIFSLGLLIALFFAGKAVRTQREPQPRPSLLPADYDQDDGKS